MAIDPCDLGEGKFCIGMKGILQENPFGSEVRKKGLSLLRTMKVKNGQMAILGVLYKTSASNRGIVFNCCPFCRADYVKHRKKKDEDGKR